ncbi:MAG: amidohydrolase family protein [Candidatus Hodarchaeales archaeon]|jgi:hypothetical protein
MSLRNEFIAFIDVNVIPMDEERILEHQTVLVQNKRIIKMAPTEEVVLPEHTLKINGTGKYLLPGLADMHTHLMNTREFLLLSLAFGVTTIRCMWGEEYILQVRKQIQQGKILGPRIYTTGPLIDGVPPIFGGSAVVESREEAEQIVDMHYTAGYDAIKILVTLEQEIYQTILKAAQTRNLPVVGHIPYKMRLEEAMKAGQSSVEHLDGYLQMIQANDSPVNPKMFQTIPDLFKAFKDLVNFVDLKKLPTAAKKTAEAGIWHCPTQIVKERMVPYEQAQINIKESHIKYVPPFIRAIWDPSKDFRVRNLTKEDWELRYQQKEIHKKIIKSLDEHGANILLGTDFPNPFVVPGHSIHEELQLMVDAGLSPYNALKTGTWNAAAFVNALEIFGTVTEGKIADLLLLEANPLQEISHSRQIAGVMVQGQWLTKDVLSKKLVELEDIYILPPDFFKRTPLLPKTHECIVSKQFQIAFNEVVVGKEEIEIGILENGHKIIVANKHIQNQGSLSTTITVDDVYQIQSLQSEIICNDIPISQMSAELHDQTLDVKLKIAGKEELAFQQFLSPCIILLPFAWPITWSLAGYEIILGHVITLQEGEKFDFNAFTAPSSSGFQPEKMKLTVERKPDSTMTTPSHPIVSKLFEVNLNARNQVSQVLLRVNAENQLMSVEENDQMGIPYTYHQME